MPSKPRPAEPVPSSEDPIGTSRLLVSVVAPASEDRAAAVLGLGRSAWLGELVEAGEHEGAGRYLLDLELRVSDSAPRVAFRKAAYIDVGPLEQGPDGPAIDVSWRAAGLATLFPVFAGRLAWHDAELVLDGYYAPPGGSVGVIADRLLLNVAARATGTAAPRAHRRGDGGGARLLARFTGSTPISRPLRDKCPYSRLRVGYIVDRYSVCRTRATVNPERSPDLGRFAEPALLVLVSLTDRPKHGYAIMADVEAFSGSPLGPGTLYAVLARLEQAG